MAAISANDLASGLARLRKAPTSAGSASEGGDDAASSSGAQPASGGAPTAAAAATAVASSTAGLITAADLATASAQLRKVATAAPGEAHGRLEKIRV